MKLPAAAPLALTALSCALLAAPAARAAPQRPKPPEWLAEQLPLPLIVRTPQELAFKAAAERQYLVFNLLASGKLLWDAGDFAGAAARWEALLAIHGLDPELDRVVRPLAVEARAKAGQPAAALPPPPPAREADGEPRPERPRKAALVAVEGTVSGGGPAGPGGAVVTLKRTDGPMPRLVPVRGRVVLQQGKTFLPRVVALPVGSSILFRNEDPLFHNVFSLSKPAPFDVGLPAKAAGEAPREKEQEFDKPGVVQLLCNIHAQMQAWVVVVDTPLYGQADGAGAFRITGVPPGEYEVEVWHEFASKPTRQPLTVGKDGAKAALAVGGDRVPPGFVPDKYGQPRQAQLGY